MVYTSPMVPEARWGDVVLEVPQEAYDIGEYHSLLSRIGL